MTVFMRSRVVLREVIFQQKGEMETEQNLPGFTSLMAFAVPQPV